MTINNLLDSLTTSGWYVWDDFLSTTEIQSIKDCIPDTLQEAKIGNGGSLQLNTNVRGDVTLWLDDDMGDPIKNYFDKMDDVRQELNAGLYLGLRDFETHFCRYKPGAFYQKHLDNPQAKSRRKVTTVLYMNEDWQAGDGGELVVYDRDDAEFLTLEPKAGRMIFFMSEQFPHEVLPTNTIRESIAGWFLNSVA